MQIDVNCSADQESDNPVILHVMVIGFHHKKGSQVDYCYPALRSGCRSPDEECSDSDELPLPVQWKSLPSLALPDGAHNFTSDTVFFHLPVLEREEGERNCSRDGEDYRQLCCVSCYKQVVASDSLKETDSSITRSTIMKAVVVISRLPYYGLIAAKTESMTRVYFKQHDFRDTSCLTELYSNLNYVLSRSQREILSPTDTSLLSLSPSRYLISQFGHRIIVLFKLLLLEKKVLFYLSLSSNPTPALTNHVTQYQSFSEATGSSGVGTDALPSVKNLCLVVLTLTSLIPVNFHSHTRDYHLYCTHCQSSHDKSEASAEEAAESIDPNVPSLEIFRDGNEIHPYLCLSYIDKIVEHPACIVGATNALFKAKKSCLFDVSVDCQTGRIEFEDPDLKKVLAPSTEDLRFADFLCKHAVACNPSLDPKSNGSRDHLPTDSFEGGDDWLRIQFNVYLLHALRTSLLRDDLKEVATFNPLFMRYWKERTENYRRWKENFLQKILSEESDSDQVEEKIRNAFQKIRPGHPSSSHKSNVSNAMTDMKLRFMSSYGQSLFPASSSSNSSPSNPPLSSARSNSSSSLNDRKQSVLNAGRNAISSAKSTFTSWISSNPHHPGSEEGSYVPEAPDVVVDDCQENTVHKDFDYVQFSSLLRREDEDKEAVVYDRKDFAP